MKEKEKFHLNQTYVNIILVCEGREDIFYGSFYLIAIKVNEGIEQLKREERDKDPLAFDRFGKLWFS